MNFKGQNIIFDNVFSRMSNFQNIDLGEMGPDFQSTVYFFSSCWTRIILLHFILDANLNLSEMDHLVMFAIPNWLIVTEKIWWRYIFSYKNCPPWNEMDFIPVYLGKAWKINCFNRFLVSDSFLTEWRFPWPCNPLAKVHPSRRSKWLWRRRRQQCSPMKR